MRTRYTIDATSGLLVDRDGHALGRVVGLTIETLGTGGVGGVGASLSSQVKDTQEVAAHQDGVQGKPNQASEAVARVWAYWLEISGRSQKLDAKRSRIIRNALKLTSEDRVMQALYGLSCSPHHNGANEQHRAYLEIRYALKGIGDESDEERIEKAIGWGRQNGENRMDPDKVSRLLEAARYTWSLPHKPERARGEAARAALEKAGFRVEEVEGPPYLRIVR